MPPPCISILTQTKEHVVSACWSPGYTLYDTITHDPIIKTAFFSLPCYYIASKQAYWEKLVTLLSKRVIQFGSLNDRDNFGRIQHAPLKVRAAVVTLANLVVQYGIERLFYGTMAPSPPPGVARVVRPYAGPAFYDSITQENKVES